jgi:hypothetical protein
VKNACAYNLECLRGIDVHTVHRLVGARLGREAIGLGSSRSG